jgi:hypothetical protein
VASVAGPRPACGVHPPGSSSGPAVQPSGVQFGVRSPGVVVQGPGSGRTVSTRLVSSRLVSTPSVRTDASVPSTSGGGGGDQAGAAGHPAPRARVQVPVGGRAVEQPGRRPREAWTRTTLPRPRVGQRGRRRTRAGLGEGGGACPLPGQAGQAGVGSARGWRLREGRGAGASARLLHRPRGCRPRAGWATTVGGGRGACRAGGWARRGRWACRRGWACGPSAAQAGSQRSRVAAAAL